MPSSASPTTATSPLSLHDALPISLGLQIAKRDESLLQCSPHRVGGPRRTQRDSCLQNVYVVAALRRVLAPQEYMRVRIDQPRQNRRIRKINHLRPRRDRRRIVCYFLDALPAHENKLILPRRL